MPKGIYLHKKRSEKYILNIKIARCRHFNKPVDDIVRFWSYVDIKAFFDCWEWKGVLDTGGYGRFGIKGKMIRASKLAYQFYYGAIPDGKQVNHKCHNRPCCNPFHLYAGTQKENIDDMIKAGRQIHQQGELHGRAKLTEQQVIEIRENRNNLSQVKLGKLYNIDPSVINRILRNKSWTHI